MVAATGIGSGLDIEGIVSALISAERSPVENRLLEREANLTNELSGFGTLQGALSNVQSSLSTLSNLSTFNQRTVTSSDDTVVSASADASAATGSYAVSVSQLAQAQSLASGVFSSSTDVVGEGVLTFRFGTTAYTDADPGPESYDGFTINGDRATATLTIDSSNNSLAGVRDAINQADFGVSATLVNDGSGVRLLLTSDQTGAENSIEISVDDTGDGIDTDDSGLSRLAFNADAAAANGGVAPVQQTLAAQDAALTINGLSISSADNTVEDVVDGVTISLNNLTEGTPETLTVADNRAEVRSAIDGFVNAFNSFNGVANNLTSYDPETGVAGSLQGDATARSIINQVRTGLSRAAEGFNGAFSTLAELGITTQADGSLSINDTTLNAALEDNFDAVAGVFAQVGSASDAGVEVLGSNAATAVDSFSVSITQIATQGSLLAAAITAPSGGSPLTIDDSNDSFTISVDGTSSGSISLTQGDFSSGEELAAELQARINGDSALAAAGASVAVSFTAGDQLQITSNRFGSASSVEITEIDGASGDLGLSVATGTDGVDVAGSIGGVAATGVGQTLTGAVDSDAAGLRLRITGTELGDRGTVDVSRGVAVQLGDLLSQFLRSDGLLDLRSDGIQSSVDQIGEDREALDRRLDALEARFRQQFNALDILLANLQSTGSFISQQLANIPVPGSSNSN